MEIKAGFYYRRTEDGSVVKVLHPEVFPHECSCGALATECEDAESVVVYRHNDDAYPHRSEFMTAVGFSLDFIGPLDWDTARKAFE